MTNQHPNANGRSKETNPVEKRALQAMSELSQESRQARDPGEPQAAEWPPAAGPVTEEARSSDWQSIALWVFVVVSFAALVFAGYVLWAKCKGPSSF
jgi:ferric-dicitrate binding protein FerR (iron transport regulator)